MRRRDLFIGFGATAVANCFAERVEAQQQNGSPSLGLRYLPNAEFTKVTKNGNVMATIPPSATVRSILPPVGDQGGQGSCVGWSTGYGLASAMLRRRGLADARCSPSYIFNRGTLTDSIANNWQTSCTSGMYIETALSYLQGFGALSLAAFPYSQQTCSDLPRFWQDKLARSNRVISDWGAASDMDVVKSSLAAGIPAIIGMSVRQQYLQLRRHEVYDSMESDPVVGPHAMLVVGFDDTRGAFELMNSWGPNWGNSGFAWVGYSCVMRDAVVDGELRMYTVRPVI